MSVSKSYNMAISILSIWLNYFAQLMRTSLFTITYCGELCLSEIKVNLAIIKLFTTLKVYIKYIKIADGFLIMNHLQILMKTTTYTQQRKNILNAQFYIRRYECYSFISCMKTMRCCR
jgi:hypothetical protein